ncbi:MAG: heme o synthase [Acidobacteriota bacterium]
MKPSPASQATPRAPRRSALSSDLAELIKARIALMVVITTAAGFLLASPWAIDLRLFLATLVGTALVASGAGVLNQVLEAKIDERMERTADRPIPGGRIGVDLALTLGILLSVTGLLQLAWMVNLLTAVLGAATLAGYIFVYTPMKRWTSLSTIVGAVPGAVPPMMGWTAARNSLDAGAWGLFAILFLWQMPHFLAIAWMYRDDYRRGGFPMLPVIDPDGERTARQAVLYGAALVPTSLLPTVLGLTGTTYFVGAMLLSVIYLACSFSFQQERSRHRARRLLLASVIYLPALLAIMFADRYFI